ncbi:MAG: hypothetical protein NTV46_15670 [Verrucomicrobia bacterium]|nr:hypothetical protein [Verrucomicrobiota bacterium]
MMPADLSILQLSLLALAAPVVVFNWGGFIVSLRNKWIVTRQPPRCMMSGS